VRGATSYYTLTVPGLLSTGGFSGVQILGIQNIISSAGVTRFIYSEADAIGQISTRKGFNVLTLHYSSFFPDFVTMDANRFIDINPQYDAQGSGGTYSCSCSFHTSDLPQAVCTIQLDWPNYHPPPVSSGTYPVTTVLVDDAGHLVSATAYASSLA
jgi:hypothetical protein